MWGQLFILISALLCIYIVIKYYSSEKKDFNIILILSALFLMASELTSVITADIWVIIPEFLLILSVSVLLIALLILIRMLRPPLFQYPYIIVYTPLILAISYMIVLDIEIMKHVFLMAAQGVAIFVFIALCYGYRDRVPGLFLVSTASFLLIISFIIGWFLQEILMLPNSLWRILFSLGMVLGVYCLSGLTEDRSEREAFI